GENALFRILLTARSRDTRRRVGSQVHDFFLDGPVEYLPQTSVGSVCRNRRIHCQRSQEGADVRARDFLDVQVAELGTKNLVEDAFVFLPTALVGFRILVEKLPGEL